MASRALAAKSIRIWSAREGFILTFHSSLARETVSVTSSPIEALQHLIHAKHNGIEIDDLGEDHLPVCKREQLVRKCAGAVRGAVDLTQTMVQVRSAFRQPLCQHLS